MKRPRKKMAWLSAALFAVGANGYLALPHQDAHAAATLPLVTVTGVQADSSSAKIDFKPVAGAKDYRVFDVSDPHMVKYAGMVHLKCDPYSSCAFNRNADGSLAWPLASHTVQGGLPESIDIPNTEIEWNELGDGKPHTLVVQAVDQLGPTPHENQYDADNNPDVAPTEATWMAGSDEGATGDGNVSINGQGPYTDTPQVIAQSAPFVVQANPTLQAIPSSPDATQTFFDTFDSAASDPIKQTGTVDPVAGTMSYSMGAGTSHPWTLQYLDADTNHSYPFVMDGHFMDTLFDGGTPGTSGPPHIAHGVETMSPDPTLDLSGGKVAHITMEVDAHVDSRRWVAIDLAPASDPLTSFYTEGSRLNNSGKALFVQMFQGTVDTDQFVGNDPTTGNSMGRELTGSFGTSGQVVCRCQNWSENGHGLDNRSRFDLFVTQTHLALFEDGQMVYQVDIPGGLGFSNAKVYFSHYLYHSALEQMEVAQSQPWETYWLNQMPFSDERHWDNMGMETLPASDAPANGNFATFASLIHMPQAQSPTTTQSTPVATAAPVLTNTPLPTNTPTSVPTNTPTSTATSVPTSTPTNVPTSTATSVPTSTPANTATPPALLKDPVATNTPQAQAQQSTSSGSLPPGNYTIETIIRDGNNKVVLDTTTGYHQG